jgi:hypothetical protein
MNQSYYQSVIDDREREVVKNVEEKHIYRHFRESIAKRQDASEKGKNILSSWIWMIAKRLVGVFQVNDKSNVKA